MLGLLLSVVGLYGVVADSVRERARVFGIRPAVGARPTDVRRLVLGQGFRTMATGLVAGTAATTALAQLMRAGLFGVRAPDLLLVAGVCAVLLMTGFAALSIPARRASRVGPARTLRAD